MADRGDAYSAALAGDRVAERTVYNLAGEPLVGIVVNGGYQGVALSEVSACMREHGYDFAAILGA